MQLERTPQPGQVWQHYKGNDYKIILVTNAEIPDDDLSELNDCIESIKHSETSYECLLAYDHGKSTLIYEHEVYTGNLFEDPHVIYQRVESEFPQVWARPLDNFLEIISSPYIDGVVSSNYARFNKIS
jgi:hypothetical protein